MPRIAEIPFTSERKRHTTVHVDRDNPAELRVFVKGAPEILLAKCRYRLAERQGRPAQRRRAAPSSCNATKGSPARRCARSPSPRAPCRRQRSASIRRRPPQGDVEIELPESVEDDLSCSAWSA